MLLKVLIVSTYFPPYVNGQSRFLKDLSDYLCKKVDLTIMTMNTKPKNEVVNQDGIEVIRLSSSPKIGPFHLNFGLSRWIKNIDADVVNIFSPFPTFEMSYLSADMDKPLVITKLSDRMPGSIFSLIYMPFFNRICEKANYILVSQRATRISSGPLLRFADKCLALPFGINVNEYKLTEQIEAKALEFRGKFRNPIILYIGNLSYDDGIVNLIRAMIDIMAVLVIVGTGETEDELKILSKNLGLSTRVIFTGELKHEEKKILLHSCDLVAVPEATEHQKLGMVQLEAMACGKPVISSSTIPENDRININGVTGLTVDPHSSYSIAGALKKILQSEDVSFEFGRNALAHVRENYNIDKAGETVFSLFQQLMSEFIPRDFFGDQGSSADNSTGGIKDDEKDNSTV